MCIRDSFGMDQRCNKKGLTLANLTNFSSKTQAIGSTSGCCGPKKVDTAGFTLLFCFLFWTIIFWAEESYCWLKQFYEESRQNNANAINGNDPEPTDQNETVHQIV